MRDSGQRAESDLGRGPGLRLSTDTIPHIPERIIPGNELSRGPLEFGSSQIEYFIYPIQTPNQSVLRSRPDDTEDRQMLHDAQYPFEGSHAPRSAPIYPVRRLTLTTEENRPRIPR